MPSHEDETRKRYQSNEYAINYKKEYVSGWAVKSIRSRIIKNLEINTIRKVLHPLLTPKSSVIDIPCGTGKLGSLLSEYDITIIAADVSNEMIALAKDEYEVKKISFMQIDATNIKMDDNSVNTVVCLRLFQRLDTPTRKKILKEFNRIANKDLVISYSYTSFWQKMRSSLRKLYDVEKNIFFSPTVLELLDEIQKAGFVIKNKKYINPVISSEVIIHASKK